MTLSIITVSRYYDKELFRTIKSVDDEFSSFINNHEVEHIVVCSENVEYENLSGRKYIYIPPKGIYNAMNVGLNNATGEWLWFLNAGDECMKNISIELLCTIDSCKASVIKSGVQAIKQNTKIMFGRVVSPHQGTFYRRNVLTSIGGYREDYKIISDWIAFNVLLSKNTKMHQSELIVAKFYENGVSSTQQGKRLISKEALKYAIECPTDLFRWYRFFKSIYKLCRKILQ